MARSISVVETGISRTPQNNVKRMGATNPIPSVAQTTTKVSKNSNGQYQITIPKALAESMNLEGERMAWSVVAARKLELEPADQ